MPDIDFLGTPKKDDSGKKPAPKAGPDEVPMHVPAPPPAAPQGPPPPSALEGLKALFPPTPPQPQAAGLKPQAPPGILSAKVPTAKLSEPVIPKAAIAPPPPPKKPEPAKGPAGDTLRVSLIATAAGGLSEQAVRDKTRAFIMILVLALAVDGLIFGGLLYYRSLIGKQTADLAAEVRALDGQIAESEKRTQPARGFQELLKSAEEALKAHRYWTNFLAMLEQLAKPEVLFTNLAGGEDGNFVTQVRAKDYTTLARQIVAFRRDPRIKKVDFSGASFSDKDGASASLNVSFDPSVLLYRSATGTAEAGR